MYGTAGSMYYPQRFSYRQLLFDMPLRDRTGFRRPLYEYNAAQRQGMPIQSPGAIHTYSPHTAIRPVMLYDEGLEYENCHTFATSSERFYEEILTPTSMTAEDPWKKTQMNISLPTPPSTPEKSSQRLRNSKMLDPAMISLNYNNNFYSNRIQQSPNNNLQVVPDNITGDDVQDIIPFLTDLGNRSVASPNFFSDTSVSNSQHRHSPSPCKSSENLVSSPSFSPADHIAICGFNEDEQSYHQTSRLFNDAGNEASYQLSNYSEAMTDNRCTTIPVSMSNLREPAVPECMLSPVSPTKSLKRPYSAIATMPNATPRNQNVPTSAVVRKLDFMDDYHHNSLPMSHNNVTVTQNIGSITQNGTSVAHNNGCRQLSMRQNEQYMRQIAASSLDSFAQADDTVGNGETELSRATHNVLERQRRNDLKMRFHMLRDNLPDLMNNEKAPKIQILKKAYEFTQELKAQEQRLLADKELERQRKFILIRRLNALRQGYF